MRRHVTTAFATSTANDATAGEQQHDEGTALNEAYAGWAEVALGYESFAAFLEAEYPHGKTAAYDRMRLADATTKEKARAYRLSRATEGMKLLPFFGVSSLAALENKDLPITNPKTNRPWRFPATVAVLRASLAVKRAESLRAAEPPTPRDVSQAVRTGVRVIEEQLEKHPSLKALRPTMFVRGGEARLSVRTVGLDLLPELGELVEALAHAHDQ
jgi:hypothetical protein